MSVFFWISFGLSLDFPCDRCVSLIMTPSKTIMTLPCFKQYKKYKLP